MYKRQEWKDEIPDLSKPILDSTGKQKMDPQTGRPLWELVQEGTRITSARMNYMEDGIQAAHDSIENISQSLTPESIGAAKKSDLDTHIQDATRHITAAERNTWNAKETPEGAQVKANQAEANAKGHANWLVGDLGQLQTANKSNAVGAINEVFQSGVRAKSDVVAELNAKKIPATMNDPWATLASKIGQIRTDIKMADGGGSGQTLEVNNLDFEPIIVFAKMGLNAQGEGYWVSNTPGLLFVKDNSSLSNEYVSLNSYIGRERYLNGSARVTWKSNGFSLDASVSGSHDIQNFGISRWCAFGI